MTAGQLAFDYARLRQPIQQRFDAWIASPDGQTVYGELCRRALSMRRSGWQHYSGKALIEAIRYSRDVELGPDHGFRINNNYTSRLVRRAIAEHPELVGWFEVRELRERSAA